MAINLATKFSDKIATAFTHGSYVKAHTNGDYKFTGVKTLEVVTPQTVPMAAYKRDVYKRQEILPIVKKKRWHRVAPLAPEGRGVRG